MVRAHSASSDNRQTQASGQDPMYLWRDTRRQVAQRHQRGVQVLVLEVVEEALAQAEASGVVRCQAVGEGDAAGGDEAIRRKLKDHRVADKDTCWRLVPIG